MPTHITLTIHAAHQIVPAPVAAPPAQRTTRKARWAVLGLVAALVASCAPLVKLNDPTPALLLPITQAENHLAKGDTKAVQADLEQEKIVIKTVVAQDEGYQRKLAADEVTIKKLNSDFLSPRQRHLCWWFIGIGSVFLLGYVGFSLFSGATLGPVAGGVILHGILAFFTGGFSLVHVGFAWLGAHLWHQPTIAARSLRQG